MDWHDQQDLARYRKRKRQQKEYQRDYRAEMAKAKIPERDDVATALMRVYVGALADDHTRVAGLTRALLNGLETRGFDREVCAERIKATARRERTRNCSKERAGA